LRHTLAVLLAALAASPPTVVAAEKPRARELGLVPLIGGTAGRLDAITDGPGVEVGHTTLVSGEGRLVPGKGPVRTGVTVVHPRGKASGEAVFGAWFTLNGNGEMTGTTWLQESGFLEGPVAITNTHSVGVVRDAILQWQASRPGLQPWGLPVVAETWDGLLNDLNGFHVTPEHTLQALDGARAGPVAEGNVGGGTGMICHSFKGGIGTASRVLPADAGSYTVGGVTRSVDGWIGQRDHFRFFHQLEIANVLAPHHSGAHDSDVLPASVGRDALLPQVRLQDALTPFRIPKIAHDHQAPTQVGTVVADVDLSPINDSQMIIVAEEDIVGVEIEVYNGWLHGNIRFVGL